MNAEALEDLRWDCAGDDMPQGHVCWLCQWWRGTSPLTETAWGVCELWNDEALAGGSCGNWEGEDDED